MPGIIERWRSLFRPSLVLYNFGPDAPTDVLTMTARTLYNTQDNLAAVVNFLANSIAQLPLKVYTRDGDDDRKRDRDSVAAKLLWKPNADQTEYEFIRALMTEYYVFGCVYVWLLPDPDRESGQQLRIIPTDWIQSTERENNYSSSKIVVSSAAGTIEIPRTEYVRFATYSPGNPGGYAHELVKVLDYLLPEGEIFHTVNYAGQEEISQSDADCVDIPMAVLVNESSYSAAEFFAAALQRKRKTSILSDTGSGTLDRN